MSGFLDVRIDRSFTTEMEKLRVLGWSGEQFVAAKDHFDERSHHVVAIVNGAMVGMIRMTEAEPSVLQEWSEGMATLPHGPGVLELTRGVVHPGHRGLGLYRLMMLVSMLRGAESKFELVTAAVEPDFFGRKFLAELGFMDKSAPIPFHDLPREVTPAVCILAEITTQNIARWIAMLSDHVRLLETLQWRVELPNGIFCVGSSGATSFDTEYAS